MNASELLPAQFNAATWFVDRNVTEGRGAVPAFSYEGNTLSYADVLELVNRTGNALLDFGVEPGVSGSVDQRSEEHTSELQSPDHLVCRLLLEKKEYATRE